MTIILVTSLSGGASVTYTLRVPLGAGTGDGTGTGDGAGVGTGTGDGAGAGDGTGTGTGVGAGAGVGAGSTHAPVSKDSIAEITITIYNFGLCISYLLMNRLLHYITKKELPG